MRLIDADALIARAYIMQEPNGFIHSVVTERQIVAAQTIEAEPVRHGRWVMTIYTTTSKRGRVISNKRFACSECGYSNGRKQSNYCPNCGAKMDKESNT